MANEDLDFNEDEFLYEFLERKPTVRFFYALLVVLACVFGLIANSLVVYMKLRNFRNRSTFDLLIANTAAGLNLLAVRFMLIMIEETTHDVMSLPLCYLARLAVDFSTPVVVTSLVALMICIKHRPNLDRETELKMVAAMWIYAALIALPVYNIAVVEFTSWKVPHHICLLYFKDDPLHTKYLIRLWISVGFKIFLPLLVTIGFFAWNKCNFAVAQYRSLWAYSIVVSVYYFVFSTASVITPLISIHFGILIGKRIAIYVAFNMMCYTVALSPAALFYCDRDFYEQTIELVREKLKLKQTAHDEFNEIVFDGKNMQSIDIV